MPKPPRRRSRNLDVDELQDQPAQADPGVLVAVLAQLTRRCDR